MFIKNTLINPLLVRAIHITKSKEEVGSMDVEIVWKDKTKKESSVFISKVSKKDTVLLISKFEKYHGVWMQ